MNRIKIVLLTAAVLISGSGSARECLAGPYRLAAGDEIEIFIWDNPELSRRVEVMMDGSISMPLIGRINAEGVSPEELEGVLSAAFANYIRQPRVSVLVSSYSRWVVSIFGEVSGAGQRGAQYPYYEGMGLLELLARAGGFSREARLTRTAVLRDKGSGGRERLEIDLKAILDGREPDFMLRMGDVVYIPHTGLSAWNYFIRNVMPTLSFIATMVTMSALLF